MPGAGTHLVHDRPGALRGIHREQGVRAHDGAPAAQQVAGVRVWARSAVSWASATRSAATSCRAIVSETTAASMAKRMARGLVGRSPDGQTVGCSGASDRD